MNGLFVYLDAQELTGALRPSGGDKRKNHQSGTPSRASTPLTAVLGLN